MQIAVTMKDVDQKFATMYYATQMRSAMFDVATDNMVRFQPPVTSFHWSSYRPSLGVTTGFDQKIKIMIVTNISKYWEEQTPPKLSDVDHS